MKEETGPRGGVLGSPMKPVYGKNLTGIKLHHSVLSVLTIIQAHTKFDRPFCWWLFSLHSTWQWVRVGVEVGVLSVCAVELMQVTRVTLLPLFGNPCACEWRKFCCSPFVKNFFFFFFFCFCFSLERSGINKFCNWNNRRPWDVFFEKNVKSMWFICCVMVVGKIMKMNIYIFPHGIFRIVCNINIYIMAN